MKTIAPSAALLAASLVLASCASPTGDTTASTAPGATGAPPETPTQSTLPAPEPNPVGSTIWKELPVYEVVQNGATPAQSEALYAALGLGRPRPEGSSTVIDYTDTERYLDVPTTKVSDSRALEALKPQSP